jgi:hypothetical protein
MALTYGFYNSLNGDRKYDAVQMSKLFNGIIKDGIFSTIGSCMTVRPGSGMQVIVGIGRAWFNNTWTDLDAELPLAISDANLTLSRIDSVILEVNSDLSVRVNTIKVLIGTPASSPVAPTLTNNEMVHQYLLANVNIAVGAESFANADIANNVGSDTCPFIVGALTTISVGDFFTKFEEEFNYWFNSMKNQLTTDAAGNLQNQVNALDTKEDSGWTPSSETFVRGSVTTSYGNASALLTIANKDVTTTFKAGCKLKFAQSLDLTRTTAGCRVLFENFENMETNSATGTIVNGLFGGKAISMDGTSQFISKDGGLFPGSDIDAASSFTFETRITTSTVGRTIFNLGIVSTYFYGIIVGVNASGVVNVELGNGISSVPTAFQGKTNVADGISHHIIVSGTAACGGTLRIYVDGILDKTYRETYKSIMSMPVAITSPYIRIGCKCTSGTNSNFYLGIIDELYFTNKVSVDDDYVLKEAASLTQFSGIMNMEKKFYVLKSYLSSGNTILKVWPGNDYTIYISGENTTSGWSNPCYSYKKEPKGFSIRPEKWSIRFVDTTLRTQASVAAGTWTYLGLPSQFTLFPEADWRLTAKFIATQILTGTAGNLYLTLSTDGSTETLLDTTLYTNKVVSASTTGLVTTIVAQYSFNINGVINVIPMVKSTLASTSLNFRNDVSKMVLEATLAWL